MRHIPNLVTLLNLFTGCIGIVLSIAVPVQGAYLVFLAALWDVLDGALARVLKAQSPIGKDLDSLADLVSFGVLPALFCIGTFNIMLQGAPMEDVWKTLCVLGFLLIPVLSALRLARFNHDSTQSHYFKGLPTPANAMFLAGVVISLTHENWIAQWVFPHPWILLVIALLAAALLNAPVRLLSFKVPSGDRTAVKLIALLIAISVGSLLFLGFVASLILLPLYLIVSILNTYLHEIRRRD